MNKNKNNTAINELLTAGRIERQSERRGARDQINELIWEEPS